MNEFSERPGIASAMRKLGATRLYKGIYRIVASGRVEHFLYVQITGRVDREINCLCGMRFENSELLAASAVKDFSSPAWKCMDLKEGTLSLARYGLGAILGWDTQTAENLATLSAGELEARFSEEIRRAWIPIVERISSVECMRKSLLDDEEPFRWIRSSAVLRSAQIAYISYRLGISNGQLMTDLLPYQGEIIGETSIRTRLDLESYLRELRIRYSRLVDIASSSN